jgi:uncharacterized membrane-anchored protein YitT (DUF2179 family)
MIKTKSTPVRLFLVLLGSVLMAFNLNTFVKAGGLIPGGFNGLTILIQDICLRYGGFQIPFTVINYALNAVPAIFCFKFIGKKFTLYSVLMVAVSSILIDWMPSMFIDFLQLKDTLLSSVFGGLLNAVSIALCLHADATSGGTDFIAIFISEKYRKDAWNYIFAGNCVVLAAAAFLFTPEKALYSIIFQFTTTLALGRLYHSYQQRTLLIITNKPDEICAAISEMTHHGATVFDGFGSYEKKKRALVYSVVTASEVNNLLPALKKIDGESFTNVLRTEHLNGRFYQRPKD